MNMNPAPAKMGALRGQVLEFPSVHDLRDRATKREQASVKAVIKRHNDRLTTPITAMVSDGKRCVIHEIKIFERHKPLEGPTALLWTTTEYEVKDRPDLLVEALDNGTFVDLGTALTLTAVSKEKPLTGLFYFLRLRNHCLPFPGVKKSSFVSSLVSRFSVRMK